MNGPLLELDGLKVTFGSVAAVDGVSLTVRRGEAVGIVGESGSGKSATMLAALRLHQPGAARVSARRLALNGRDVLTMQEAELRDLRGGFAAMIFQDPMTALNPLLSVGAQIAEVLVRHRRLHRRPARLEAVALLEQVGISDAAQRFSQYPHEFSGGMRQRVMIASALAGNPALLIADEPTTALDVTVQSALTRLIRGLQRERQMGLVWVTHDLALMAGVVDRVVVLYAGRVMETAPIGALYASPRHPYTVALLQSLPRLGQPRVTSLSGHPPDPSTPAAGCVFAARCRHRYSRCEQVPPMLPAGDSEAACWLFAGGVPA